MDEQVIQNEIDTAKNLYTFLFKEVKALQDKIKEFKDIVPKDDKKIAGLAVASANYAADLLRVGSQITTMLWVLGKENPNELPSRAYEVKDVEEVKEEGIKVEESGS